MIDCIFEELSVGVRWFPLYVCSVCSEALGYDGCILCFHGKGMASIELA